MTHGALPYRRIILASSLALAIFAKIVDSYPHAFGWPGAYILSYWTPGPIRLWALYAFSETVSSHTESTDAVPLIKRMLRSDDPRIRRRGILFYDRIRSMDQFFELERLTRDPDVEVRASAYKHLPFPRDESMVIGVLLTGLRDDSDKVVSVAAQQLLMLRAKQALPELIAHMEARRGAGTFNEADVVIGNAASELAGLKLKFYASAPFGCGNADMWDEMEWDRPFPRAILGARSFWRALFGGWDRDRGVAPRALAPVDSSMIADNFAERDELLDWWNKRNNPGHLTARRARRTVR